MTQRAFTLIELLVVISIIALLMAILLPVLSSARESAKTVQCNSNLKQLAIAEPAYVADHKGTFTAPRKALIGEWDDGLTATPAADRYFSRLRVMTDSDLWDYVNQNLLLFRCPVATDIAVGTGKRRDDIRFTYTKNYYLNGDGGSVQIGNRFKHESAQRIDQVKAGHNAIALFGEENADVFPDDWYEFPLNNGDLLVMPLTAAKWDSFGTFHRGYPNVKLQGTNAGTPWTRDGMSYAVFLDGHVSQVEPNDSAKLSTWIPQ